MRLLHQLLAIILLPPVCFFVALFAAFYIAPTQNTTESHFDTLIILGTPTMEDGTPSAEMRERVDEGVREYRAGVAPNLIMTGGAAHNRFVKGQAMQADAIGQGVPRESITVEGQAKDTIQNIWYSRAIMRRNGWHSAEVISSPYHLPRTGFILQRYGGSLALNWRTHPAHWPPNYGVVTKLRHDAYEAFGLLKLLLHGFPTSTSYLPH